MSLPVVPDSDHISRFCNGSKRNDDGSVSGTQFRLRKDVRGNGPEEYLSGNWLEHLRMANRADEIVELQNVFSRKGFKIAKRDFFALLNVGEMRSHVLNKSPDRRVLHVLHKPSAKDHSHCGVYGLRLDDDIVSDLIAQTVKEQYPAKR